jgi:hypothetical protein
MRNADSGEAECRFIGSSRNGTKLRSHLDDGLQVDFWAAVDETRRNNACISPDPQIAIGHTAGSLEKPHGAKRRIATELAERAVTIVVANRCAITDGAKQNDSVSANTGSPRAKPPDDWFGGELACVTVCEVEEDEIIPRAAQLPESSSGACQTCLVICHHRRRQTIHTASLTIFFDILLDPSRRSTKTMGISTIRNPFRHARKVISI